MGGRIGDPPSPTPWGKNSHFILFSFTFLQNDQSGTQNKINLKWSNWSDNTSPYCKTCFSTSDWVWHAKKSIGKIKIKRSGIWVEPPRFLGKTFSNHNEPLKRSWAWLVNETFCTSHSQIDGETNHLIWNSWGSGFCCAIRRSLSADSPYTHTWWSLNLRQFTRTHTDTDTQTHRHTHRHTHTHTHTHTQV